MDSSGANAAGPSSSAPSIPPNDPRLARCGFAKLQGDGIEFFVRKYEIVIGRSSKNSTLDLILGDSTTISRQHAAIKYNFDAKGFELVVLGKNGVTVESCGSGATHLYTPESPPTPLRSRDLLIMGEKRFYFLLPRTMGGPSRKRRRLEPSPAPGAVPGPAGPSSAPAPSAPAQHPQPAPAVLTSHAAAAHVQPPQQSHPDGAAAVAPAGAPDMAAGGVPAAAPAHTSATPAHASAQPQHLLQRHQQQHAMYMQTETSGEPAAQPSQQQHQQQPDTFHMQQDEDDALINAGGLPYDNGASYGYGTGNDGFPGGF